MHYNCTIFFVMLIRFKEVCGISFLHTCMSVLTIIIMAVEMGVQSAEHLLIAEMCSKSLLLPTIHYPPSQHSLFLLKYFHAFLQSRELVDILCSVSIISIAGSLLHEL